MKVQLDAQLVLRDGCWFTEYISCLRLLLWWCTAGMCFVCASVLPIVDGFFSSSKDSCVCVCFLVGGRASLVDVSVLLYV